MLGSGPPPNWRLRDAVCKSLCRCHQGLGQQHLIQGPGPCPAPCLCCGHDELPHRLGREPGGTEAQHQARVPPPKVVNHTHSLVQPLLAPGLASQGLLKWLMPQWPLLQAPAPSPPLAPDNNNSRPPAAFLASLSLLLFTNRPYFEVVTESSLQPFVLSFTSFLSLPLHSFSGHSFFVFYDSNRFPSL